MCPVFGGSFHAPHAQFYHHSSMENNGRKVGLIRATDVSFADYFYSIRCCLWCCQPFRATVHGAPWNYLNNNKAIVVRAAADVNSNLYWRQSYVVLCTMFLALILLQFAYSNKSTMNKIYYHVHKATLLIENNAEDLNNPSLFLLIPPN